MVLSFVKAVFFFIYESFPLKRVVIGQNIVSKLVVGNLVASIIFEKWAVTHNWEYEALMALEPHTYLVVKYYDHTMIGF